ncbi:hypothetical protein Pint_18393 [Pistacia integerrima]|uniref:Uncharacterized protein n=1 Tax=Pistacia integerrima TaxID=434235 RepID=A0ACC0YXD3_9ROSI|nr:hypothetical protein Pint_18393 [Pistacia integerrima]
MASSKMACSVLLLYFFPLELVVSPPDSLELMPLEINHAGTGWIVGRAFKAIIRVQKGGVGVYNPRILGNEHTKAQMGRKRWPRLTLSSDVSNWTKMETSLEAKETDPKARLQLTTSQKGGHMDRSSGHGFRNDLARMLADVKPRFMTFPVGPWEERPGHYGDVWKYWTDDGMGYFEFLQLSEDLGTLPIWVSNMGIAHNHNDQISSDDLQPFVQEALDGLEFARGDKNSTWDILNLLT